LRETQERGRASRDAGSLDRETRNTLRWGVLAYGRWMRRSLRVVVAAACTCTLAATALAADPTGFFSQLPGAGGCITGDGTSNGGPSDCADGRGVEGAQAVALSPDGRFVYVYAYSGGTLATVSRDTTTGALSQASDASACLSQAAIAGCTDGRLPDGGAYSAHAIAISGAHLFAEGRGRDIIGTYDRDAASGALTERDDVGACVSATGADSDLTAGACSTYDKLQGPVSVAVTPDGKFLYAGAGGAVGLTAFSIDGTGALTPLSGAAGCYAATVVTGCTQARLTTTIDDVALSPDAKTLYAANPVDHAVVAFSRDAATGALTQIAGAGGCVVDDGVGDVGDPCTQGRALQTAQSVEVSPDGTLVSVGAAGEKGVAMLHRAANGALSQAAGVAGCITETGAEGCGTSRSTQDVHRTLFSPDGGTLITAGFGDAAAGSGIGVFDVRADGTLTQRAGTHGCLSDTGADSAGTAGSCTPTRGIWGAVGLAMTADGKWLYSGAYNDEASPPSA
jgi:6-phosphogluconolactonase (cycloisomerase 2 family)